MKDAERGRHGKETAQKRHVARQHEGRGIIGQPDRDLADRRHHAQKVADPERDDRTLSPTDTGDQEIAERKEACHHRIDDQQNHCPIHTHTNPLPCGKGKRVWLRLS